MTTVNNFITDLLDRAIKHKATLQLVPESKAQLLTPGVISSTGSIIRTDELVEDLEALGITLDSNQTFYYFHPVDEENVCKVKVVIEFRGNTPFTTMKPMETLPKSELKHGEMIW